MQNVSQTAAQMRVKAEVGEAQANLLMEAMSPAKTVVSPKYGM